MTDRITILRPDDMHLHLRDGDMLKACLPDTTAHFGRAIIMPNLVPPVVTGEQAVAYRDRILAALPEGAKFEPLMTLYMTEETVASDVVAAYEAGIIKAVKLYPAGATTNSAAGVRDIEKIYGVLDAMAEAGVPLCVHGEVTDEKIDIFDREAVFINRVLEKIRRSIPGLRVVMEHITTAEAAAYVSEGDDDLAATITVHHLMINRNAMLVGGIKPHYYCLPVAKREVHREMLVKLATSGAPNVFLGTDSAPHLTTDKESACGCAGIFSAGVAMGCLAEVFEREDALDTLEDFTSYNGAAFYGIPAPTEKITLVRGEAVDPAPPLETPNGTVTRFDPGMQVTWRVED